jgi:hypothetical protein
MKLNGWSPLDRKWYLNIPSEPDPKSSVTPDDSDDQFDVQGRANQSPDVYHGFPSQTDVAFMILVLQPERHLPRKKL